MDRFLDGQNFLFSNSFCYINVKTFCKLIPCVFLLVYLWNTLSRECFPVDSASSGSRQSIGGILIPSNDRLLIYGICLWKLKKNKYEHSLFDEAIKRILNNVIHSWVTRILFGGILQVPGMVETGVATTLIKDLSRSLVTKKCCGNLTMKTIDPCFLSNHG